MDDGCIKDVVIKDETRRFIYCSGCKSWRPFVAGMTECDYCGSALFTSKQAGGKRDLLPLLKQIFIIVFGVMLAVALGIFMAVKEMGLL